MATYTTTPAAVRSIVDVDADVTDAALNGFIGVAESVLNDHCLASGYTDAKLELIERYLAAHFLVVNRRQAVQEGVAGAASQTLDRPELKMRLDNTTFGQQAKLLDSAGNLAGFDNALGSVKTILPVAAQKIIWLGGYHCRPTLNVPTTTT